MTTEQITGIILAGGKSSRMQTDKGFVSYKGKLLIEHALDQISQVCSELIISANRNEYEQFGYPVVKDSIHSIGPLGGIFSSIQKSTNALNLVIACDILGTDETLLENMITRAREKILVHLLNTNRIIEPLPLVMHKRLLPDLEKRIESGDFKLQNLIHSCKQSYADAVEYIQLQKDLQNLNTMEDLKL